MTNEQFEILIDVLEANNNGFTKEIVLLVLGVVLGYFSAEWNNRKQSKRDTLKYLVDVFSEYQKSIKSYKKYVEIKIKRNLTEDEIKESNNIAYHIDVCQNRLDVIIKDSKAYKTLITEHEQLTEIVRDFNQCLAGAPSTEMKKKLAKLQDYINNYSKKISKLINK